MNKIIEALALVLVLSVQTALADEVHLICTGANSETEPVISEYSDDVDVPIEDHSVREIRFNEDTKEFWYKGDIYVKPKKAENGWVPAKRVSFGESEIEAKFAWNVNGFYANYMIKPIGKLDRMTGYWSMGILTLQCRKFEATERKF
jgi:hypothetical protein